MEIILKFPNWQISVIDTFFISKSMDSFTELFLEQIPQSKQIQTFDR